MDLEIRPGADGDLDALVAVIGQRHYFGEHLARQRDGHGILLVAWVAGGPVGTALFRAAEGVARGFGHDRIGLAVGLDNRDARRLYERLGYVDWNHGTVVVSWVERDRDGSPVRSSEICAVLLKRL